MWPIIERLPSFYMKIPLWAIFFPIFGGALHFIIHQKNLDTAKLSSENLLSPKGLKRIRANDEKPRGINL